MYKRQAYGSVIENQGRQIEDLTDRLTIQRLDLVALATQQEGFRAELDKREFNFERLKNEDPEVRSWADTVLPLSLIHILSRH